MSASKKKTASAWQKVSLKHVVWGASGRGFYGVLVDRSPSGRFAVATVRRQRSGKSASEYQGCLLDRGDLILLRDRIDTLLRDASDPAREIRTDP